ncbi:MAG: hypothetical protein WD066_09470 [Planctomycetaceae bacterium]
MERIRALLDSLGGPGTINRPTLDDVRGWLAEYVETRVAETDRFSEEKHKDHWDLLVADHDSREDAQFVAVVFSGEHATLLAGGGARSEVRAFAEDEFPEEPREVLHELSRRFRATDCVTVQFNDLLRWIQG